MMPDIEPIVRRRNRLRHQHKVVCLHWWGRLAACGGLATRQRRLPTGAQLDKLPHK